MRIPLITKLALLFIGVPLLDMGAIIVMSHYTGPWIAFGSVVACGILGAFLVRVEGIRTWNTLRTEIASGRMPETPLLDGVLVLLSGALLMTPGPLTDALGLILLLPPIRNSVRALARRKAETLLVESAATMVGQVTGGFRSRPETIERVTVIR